MRWGLAWVSSKGCRSVCASALHHSHSLPTLKKSYLCWCIVQQIQRIVREWRKQRKKEEIALGSHEYNPRQDLPHSFSLLPAVLLAGFHSNPTAFQLHKMYDQCFTSRRSFYLTVSLLDIPHLFLSLLVFFFMTSLEFSGCGWLWLCCCQFFVVLMLNHSKSAHWLWILTPSY